MIRKRFVGGDVLSTKHTIPLFDLVGANLINIFEPQAICFGGSFSYYQDVFLPILKPKLKKYVFNKGEKIDLIPAKLRNDAGIIGASEI